MLTKLRIIQFKKIHPFPQEALSNDPKEGKAVESAKFLETKCVKEHVLSSSEQQYNYRPYKFL